MTLLNLNLSHDLMVMVAGRFLPEPSPIMGVWFQIEVAYDLDVDSPPPLPLEDRDPWIASAIDKYTTVVEALEPYLSGTYLGQEDAVLFSLADRNLRGGNAANLLRSAIEGALSVDGFFDGTAVVPPHFVGRPGIKVLPDPTLDGVYAFIVNRLEAVTEELNLRDSVGQRLVYQRVQRRDNPALINLTVHGAVNP